MAGGDCRPAGLQGATLSLIGPETSEFRSHFAEQTHRLLRRRLVLFIAIWGGLSALGLLSLIGMYAVDLLTGSTKAKELLLLIAGAGVVAGVVYVVATACWYAGYLSALYLVLRRKNMQVSRVVNISIGLIVLDGLLAIVLRAAGMPMYGLWVFMISHFVACCLFPWTVRQAIAPVVMILLLSMLSWMTIESVAPSTAVLRTLILLVTFVPAVVICSLKHSKRVQDATSSFLRDRYGALRRELANARQIHESMFPKPSEAGGLRFDYRYVPMRQIGGDYLYARFGHTALIDHSAGLRRGPKNTVEEEPDRFDLLVLDVTGHGLAAALTVNRLYGEVERLFAENPSIRPGDVLKGLNSYVHLTLSPHSIYVTALCMRIDLRNDELEYASGGHPPAFVRTADGRLEQLDSTAFVLGACANEDFDPEPRTLTFAPGDQLIAYTDGAIEARDRNGKMFGLKTLMGLIASAPRQEMVISWSQALLSRVEQHRAGVPEDDVLIVEVSRKPVRGGLSGMFAGAGAAAGSEQTSRERATTVRV